MSRAVERQRDGFPVGSVVRVRSSDGVRAVRAVVSYTSFDGTDFLYDVEYIGAYRHEESEGGVSASRVYALLDFEAQHIDATSMASGSRTSCGLSIPVDAAPDRIKEWGNALFKQGDFDGALRYYQVALVALQRLVRALPLSVGSPVLVLTPAGETVLGMVSGLSDTLGSSDVPSEGRFDILYENDIDYSKYGAAWEGAMEEEEGVDAAALIPALPSTAGRPASNASNGDDYSAGSPLVTHTELVVSLHLNMAKCFVKFRMHGWSLRHVTIAKGHIIWSIHSCGGFSAAATAAKETPAGGAVWVPGAEARLRDVLHLRARMFLEANRPGRCIKDAEVLAGLGDLARSAALVRQARDLAERNRRSNRALVREVVRWVDSAMASAPLLANSDAEPELAPDLNA